MLGCLCGKAVTIHLRDGSAHSSGCVVNGSNAMAAFITVCDMNSCCCVSLSHDPRNHGSERLYQGGSGDEETHSSQPAPAVRSVHSRRTHLHCD